MNLQDLRAQLPNFATYRDWLRPDAVEGIVVHHSGPGTVDANGLPTLDVRAMAEAHVRQEGRAHVSYHYAIGADGTIFYLLDERIAGYHAALREPPRLDPAWQRWQGAWLNGQWFNRRTIGIVVLGWFEAGRRRGAQSIADAHTTPPPAQWAALVELIQAIRTRHAIPIERVEGHREALARAGFGATSCPGPLFDLARLRADVASEVPSGPVVVPGAAPALPALLPHRPLIGLHGRNDFEWTPTDWAIVQAARVESLKLMSFTPEAVFARARAINPQVEFIVRLYAGSPGAGRMPGPLAFADRFREPMERLFRRFGVLKWEIHNEPNHLSGAEGWGQGQTDAAAFAAWYREVFAILRERHPWALLGYPGLAVPHNDLEWLDWNRDEIEASDFLGCHIYWQTPPGQAETFKQDFWGLRFKAYHAKFPHKPIEISEFGNSNGQSGLPLTREEQRQQVDWWLRHIQAYPYLGSAHGFIATSPDPQWEREGFTWGDASGPFPVAAAVGAIPRPPRRPDWLFAVAAKLPARVATDAEITFPVRLRNEGRLPWRRSGAARTVVVARWFDAAGAEIGPSASVLLPRDMRPDDEAHFTLTLRAPAEADTLRLRLALFCYGQRAWLHDLNPASAPAFWEVAVVAPRGAVPPPRDLVAGYTLVAAPTRGLSDGAATATVEARNNGTRGWETRGDERGSVRFGAFWQDETGQKVGDESRAPLPAPVAPGQSARAEVPLRLPAQAGRYTLRLGVVSEWERWLEPLLAAPVEVEAASAPMGVAYRATLPDTMTVGERREVAVELRNVGGRTWETAGSAPVTLVHTWRDEAGQLAHPSPPMALPGPVRPGESVSVTLALLAPAEAGRYTLRLDMAEAGRGFFSQQGNTPLSAAVTVEAAAAPDWAAEWLEVLPPDALASGETGRLDIRLRNRGTQTWAAARVRVLYRWDDGSGARVALPADVPPGGEVALGLPIVAPLPGARTLTVGLWEEGVGWRERFASTPTVAIREPLRPLGEPVVVRALPSPPAEPAPAAPGRALVLRRADASHNADAAPLALDGDPATAWASGAPQRPSMWFAVELAELQPVRAIHLASPPDQHPRGFRLEASLDGETWETLDEVAENWSPVALRLGAPRRARFLRLTLTHRSPWHPWSVSGVSIEGEVTSDE